MKTTKKILAFAIIMSVCNNSYSADNKQPIQTATLKNGSVLYGYIQNNDGYGNLTFHSDSAIVILENVVASVTDRTINYNQLSTYWQSWADRNEAYGGSVENRNLLLSDITVNSISVKDDNFLEQMKGKQVNNVRLQERGVKYKYIEMTPNSYRLNWNDIASISAERRPKTALSGIDWICQTKNGQTFEGQYAGEDKNTTSLYLATGVKQTMKKDDVVKYTYRTVNSNQSVLEQSELLDVVRTNNLGTITGVIIEQNYTSGKNSDNYLLIQQDGGTIQSVKMSEVRELSREINMRYSPEYDIILKTGEVYINGKEAALDTVTSNKGNNILITLKPIEVDLGANNLTSVTVQYSATNLGANVEAFRVVPLKKDIKGKKDYYYFTDESLATSVYRPVSIGTSTNQTTKAVYQFNGIGYFMFYDVKTKTGYCVRVK